MPCALDTVRTLSLQVMSALGKGHRESVYRKALSTALNHKGICHRAHVDCAILFLGECVGMGQADLVIDDLVIELKVLQKVPAGASDQLHKYIESLTRTEGHPFRGAVINFNSHTGRVDVVEESAQEREQSPPKPSHKKRKLTSPFFSMDREESPEPFDLPSPVASVASRTRESGWMARVTRARSVPLTRAAADRIAMWR